MSDNWLRTSSKIEWTRIRRNPKEHWITANSEAGVDSSKHVVVIAMKSA